jgi:alkaline phosphatase D
MNTDQKIYGILLLSFFVLNFSFAQNTENQIKIAFGSCGHQNHTLPIFNTIAENKPDYFIFLGDNIYGDTDDMKILASKYKKLGKKKSYKNLKNTTKILATWDDHDFGRNDAGKEYPHKKESKEIFLKFFNEPDSSERWQHEGIYHDYYIKKAGKIIQVILLDNRTFRDKLLPYTNDYKHDSKFDFYKKDYQPHTDAAKTLLGEQQWNWLEKVLSKKADLRLICSGSQFGIEWNGYEAWANFPHEQQKMLKLIQKTKAEGVIFLTGDVHYSEISKLETDFYPIYDFTSSGLSSKWLFATPNKNRIKGAVMDNHFGLLNIDLNADNPGIKMETIDVKNNSRFELQINLNDLKFNKE